MPRWLRVPLFALALLLVAFCAAAGFVAWRFTPPDREVLALPGLSAPVDVRFDANGIPFIRAASAADAAEALGYVHARDRLFQMDLMRRVAGGTLSQLFGLAALGNDEEMRRLGLKRSAEADVADLSPEARGILQAYANGVNAWISRRGAWAAPPFLVLGKPAPWTIADSLLWGKMMGMWLSGNWRTEMARLALSASQPRDKIDALWPPVPDAVHEAASSSPALALAALRALAGIRQFPQPFTQPMQASNEWAVDGAHSATGAPLLAGDPHLGFGFPSLWYLARIDTPDGMLSGATAPGVPFMVIGQNGHIAWTFTTTGADVQDVFIEHPSADGKSYKTPTGWVPFTTRTERIHIAGHADVVLHVLQTRHGPVIGTTADGHELLAVEMANLAPYDTDSNGLLMLNRAHSVAEAAIASGFITSPVQNLLVADRTQIGFFTTGRIPIRKAGDGAWPVDGTDGLHDWTGLASGAALPRQIAPPSGILVNANNPTVGPDFPVFMGGDVFGDWRARRIQGLLTQSQAWTPAGFGKIQLDVVSLFAQALLPRMLALRAPSGATAAQALALLRGWDGGMRMDQPQPLIFNAWTRALTKEVLRRNGIAADDAPVLEDNFLLALFGTGATSAAQKMWCGGDCNAVLFTSLNEALMTLRQRYGDDASKWRWGTAHRAVFADPVLSRLPLIGGLGRFQLAAPGDSSTVDVAAPGPTAENPDGFDAIQGPELRAVFNLAALDQSLFIIAPGQSGFPLSARAANLLHRWRDGRYVTLGPAPDKTMKEIRINPLAP